MHSTDCLTNSNSCSPVPSSLWKFAGESESCWDKWTKPAQHEVRNRREDKLKFKQTSPVLSRCKMGCLSDSFVSAADRLYNAAFPLLPPLTRRELKNYKYRWPHFLISQFICWDSVLYMFVKILCVWLAHWVGCLSFHIPSCDRSISNAHTFLYLVSSCGTSRSWPSLFFVVMTFFFAFVLNYFNPKSHTHTQCRRDDRRGCHTTLFFFGLGGTWTSSLQVPKAGYAARHDTCELRGPIRCCLPL